MCGEIISELQARVPGLIPTERFAYEGRTYDIIDQKDEIVEIRVKGNDLKAVNALSFALPYDQNDFEFVGVEPLNMKAMENLTYDRLHTNGVKSLYPTFVNLGKQESLNGSEDLFILKLKAKRKVKFELTLKDGILVDKELRMHQF